MESGAKVRKLYRVKLERIEETMHEPVRERIESLLTPKVSAMVYPEAQKHLSSCVECMSELTTMKAQSKILYSLRAPEEMEPDVGFYARVLQRIEERGGNSIWSVFIYSPYGKRLAYASLAIALVLGTYVVSEESQDGHLDANNSVVGQKNGFTPVIGNQQEQRDAVLVNFASYQEGSSR